MRAADGQNARAGGDAGRCVFEDQAAAGIKAEPPRGQQEALGVWLAAADVTIAIGQPERSTASAPGSAATPSVSCSSEYSTAAASSAQRSGRARSATVSLEGRPWGVTQDRVSIESQTVGKGRPRASHRSGRIHERAVEVDQQGVDRAQQRVGHHELA
jgi:hypothetical protein